MFNILFLVHQPLPDRISRLEAVNKDRKEGGSCTMIFWVSLVLRSERSTQVSYYSEFYDDIFIL